MNRQCYLVSYDISDPKRLRQVFHICKAYGQHLQYSVFRAELTPMAKANLIRELMAVIHHREDQVLFVDVGPAEGRAKEAFSSLGRSFDAPARLVKVL